MRSTCFAVVSLACALCACDPPLSFEAQAGCGDASKEESKHSGQMLPGRECKSCHRGYTAAGTVFDTLNATCDTGVEGVKIEILDMDSNVKVTVMSNSVGNFYTKARLPTPFTARVTGPNGEVQQKKNAITDGNCSRCHRLPAVEMAKGRLALFVPLDRDAGVDAAEGSGAD